MKLFFTDGISQNVELYGLYLGRYLLYLCPWMKLTQLLFDHSHMKIVSKRKTIHNHRRIFLVNLLQKKKKTFPTIVSISDSEVGKGLLFLNKIQGFPWFRQPLFRSKPKSYFHSQRRNLFISWLYRLVSSQIDVPLKFKAFPKKEKKTVKKKKMPWNRKKIENSSS